MFDYLQPHDGPVIPGLEAHEKVYAKDQPQYRPVRTLPGESGSSAIMRYSLTPEQRKALADGADLYLEIFHFRGPLAPHRMMLADAPKSEDRDYIAWWKAQTRGTYPVAKGEE